MSNLTPVLVDAPTLRARVHEKVKDALHQVFPLDLKGRTIELKDVVVHKQDFGPNEQKHALLTGATLEEKVKGTLVLKDADGNVIDEAKNFTLAHVPYFTERHTVINQGNEYQIANMLRRKPGVYTQRSENGQLHTTFNLSKGKNLELTINPEKGTFYVSPAGTTTTIPLYPVLRALGIPHEDIANRIGKGVADVNAATYGHKQETAIAKLYQKLVHPSVYDPGAPLATKVDAIKEKWRNTSMNGEVVEHTLGERHDVVSPQALMAGAKRLLDVHEGKKDVDDSDGLMFKTFHSVDDYLHENVKLVGREWKKKAHLLMRGKQTIREGLRASPFSEGIRKFITTSSLTAVPSSYNPIDLLDHAVKVTALGEGGIPSERAIPYEARLTHPTHYGTLDPVRTPECFTGDAEVFTSKGWKKWVDVNENDTFACQIEGRLEFHSPSRLINEHYTGDLYGVNTGKLQYLVTPNHRVWCAPLDAVYPLDKQRSKSGWRFARADEAHGKSRVFDTQHLPYVGEEVEHFQLPFVESAPKALSKNGGGCLNDNIKNIGPIPMEDWAAFMGWYLSEGCVGKHEGRLTHVNISQSREANPDCCKKIEVLLSKLPFTWRYDIHSKGFIISGKQLATYLASFGFCEDKFIPEYLFNSSIKARENLLESLLLGDGRVNCSRATGVTYEQEVYCTTSKQLAIDVERLAFSLGKSIRTRKYSDKRQERYLDVYEVRILRDRYRQTVSRKDHFFTEKHDGPVYCATVPGGLMYVRRGDGIGHWSGNSGHAGVDIRASIAAHRDHEGNLYTPVYNVKTGKDDFMKAGDLVKYVVAFPHQKMEGEVDAFVNGQVQRVPVSRVDYQIPHENHTLSPATSLIPMLRNIQGNRAIMGSKMQTQGLPLIAREAPMVQVKSHLNDHSMEHHFGRMIVPTAPVAGTIAKIENGFIYIRPHAKTASDESLVKVPFSTNFPFASKTYLHHNVSAKVGDSVEAGQTLADSNFTRDGTLALGTNLRVAYMPYRGLNSNDAVVISEGAAKKLTSEHMYREVYSLGYGLVTNRDKHKAYFGPKYSPDQYSKLGDDGIVKKGSKVNPKDILVAGLTPTALSGSDVLLGKISKSLTKPFRDNVLQWDHGVPGEVVDVIKTDKQIAILVTTREQMQIGDKLAGRYGNKGVVSKIIPDHEMVQDAKGRPIDLILTSAGVVSRINPAQIIETAIGKVAEKTGKPIVYDNTQTRDAVQWAKDLLANHGISDKEHVYDPLTKRTLKGHDGKGVLVGNQYTFKLFKSTDTNFAGHSSGVYDINEQPLKVGGDESAKSVGKMEFDALLAHNARNIIRENATIRGQKNDEFWKSIQLGLPLPTPKPSFAFTKFTAMLEGAGVKVDKRNSKYKLMPLTDADIAKRSSGALENNKTVIAKNLRAEHGGLFDPRLTGGTNGTLYSHIDLHEAVVNPVFEEPVRRLLGMTEQQLNEAIAKHGGEWVKKELGLIDAAAKLKDLRSKMVRANGSELNSIVKQIKYLEALQKEGLKPHEAYVISKVPVVPPVFRPITPMPNDPNQLMVADANKLYAHLMDVNHVLKNTVLPSDLPKHRGALYNAVGAVFGTHEVENDELKGQSVKGFLSAIAGKGSPKGGFFQRKLMSRTQDVSGRGTAVPDGNLGMDQVGIPEEMLWKMWDKLLVARLVRQGHGALEARELVDKKAPAAKDALMTEVKERPVLINRAPTLHRYSIVAAYAQPVQGKTIRVNPFIEQGFNLDYDGDTIQVHSPVTHAGIEDAKKMTLPNLLLSDQKRNSLVAFPQHEAIVGFTYAASHATDPSHGNVKTFNNRDEVLAAYRKGDLTLSDHVEVKNQKTAEEFEDEDKSGSSFTSEEALNLYPPSLIFGTYDAKS